MEIQSILSPDRTLSHLDCSSKKRTLEQIASHIADEFPSLDADELFQALIARERLGSTGIGKGIAIPHCRLKECKQTVGMLITLEKAIDFEAIDNGPVDIIFTLIVPDEAHEDHLQTLAVLAEKFSESTYIDSLRHCEDSTGLYQVATGQ